MANSEIIYVCAASDVCSNSACNGEIFSQRVNDTLAKIVVLCVQYDGSGPEEQRGAVEQYDAQELADDYQDGDDIARIYIADAPVCNSNGPDDITNRNVLVNGISPMSGHRL